MIGTTPELQKAVQHAIDDQVNGIFAQDDYLVIYCVLGRLHKAEAWPFY